MNDELLTCDQCGSWIGWRAVAITDYDGVQMKVACDCTVLSREDRFGSINPPEQWRSEQDE